MDTELNAPNPATEFRCNGLLVVDKPAGVTSRDCVNRIERILRPAYPKPARLPKVGHAGTLDPLATGVLVIGIGAGVRLVPYIQQMLKTYHAHFRVGANSDTGDIDGIVVELAAAPVPTATQIQQATEQLTGEIRQVPPATSAIRVNGRKAYTYAHRGEEVEVPARTVWVESIRVIQYQCPLLECEVNCGGGTYIRTLGQDLASQCGTAAVMTALRRTAIGCFGLAQAVSLDGLDLEQLPHRLCPLAWGVSHLPQLHCSPDAIRRFDLGQKISSDELPRVSGTPEPPGNAITKVGKIATAANVLHRPSPSGSIEAKVLDFTGRLAAIVQLKDGRWSPYRVFHE